MTTTAERLEIIQTRLTAYYAAEIAVLKGQSYSIGNRSLTRADLAAIQTTIKDLETEERKISNGNYIKMQKVVPRDI